MFAHTTIHGIHYLPPTTFVKIIASPKLTFWWQVYLSMYKTNEGKYNEVILCGNILLKKMLAGLQDHITCLLEGLHMGTNVELPHK